MNSKQTPGVDAYWSALEAILPTFDEEEKRFAVKLYRELGKGEPVTAEGLAEALAVPFHDVERLLARDSIECFVFADENDRVVGFGGLATAPMSHKLELAGRTVWSWCAWDSLFIPEILGEEAHVESRDPRTGATIRLVVGPDGPHASGTETPVVSFIAVDAEQFNTSAANVMGSFCHYVFFFESRESGEAWAAEHEGAFVLALDEAADLARRLNARNWGSALTDLPVQLSSQ